MTRAASATLVAGLALAAACSTPQTTEGTGAVIEITPKTPAPAPATTTTTRATPSTGTPTTKVEAASLGYVPPPARAEPRGSDRYSIIETPNLERNLGMRAADGAAQPRDEETAPAFRSAPPETVSEQPSEPERVGPPSAADPIPWSGG